MVFHVTRLRNLSARPELIVDDHAHAVGSNSTTPAQVGIPGPLGRGRIVAALPTNKAGGPLQLVAARVLHDHTLCYLADPDGNLIGDRDAVWVHRMAYARWTQDTRRLAV